VHAALVRWKGASVSEVAPSVGGGATTWPPQAAESPDHGIDDPAAQFLRRVLSAAEDRDPLALQAQLDRAATLLGLARCIDEIVMTASRKLRGLAATGQHDAARDVMATEAIRTWLNHRGLFAPTPRPVGPIVLACGPRDRHLVDLESLGLLLRFRRWPCRVLGGRISTFALTVAAQAADAAGVVVMSTENRARQHAIGSIRAVAATGIPVFYAGSTFEPELSRQEVPGRYLGAQMEPACALLIESLAPHDAVGR
jgi:hypothetical protein